MDDIEKIKAAAYDRIVKTWYSNLSFRSTIAAMDHIFEKTDSVIKERDNLHKILKDEYLNGTTHAKRLIQKDCTTCKFDINNYKMCHVRESDRNNSCWNCAIIGDTMTGYEPIPAKYKDTDWEDLDDDF